MMRDDLYSSQLQEMKMYGGMNDAKDNQDL